MRNHEVNEDNLDHIDGLIWQSAGGRGDDMEVPPSQAALRSLRQLSHQAINEANQKIRQYNSLTPAEQRNRPLDREHILYDCIEHQAQKIIGQVGCYNAPWAINAVIPVYEFLNDSQKSIARRSARDLSVNRRAYDEAMSIALPKLDYDQNGWEIRLASLTANVGLGYKYGAISALSLAATSMLHVHPMLIYPIAAYSFAAPLISRYVIPVPNIEWNNAAQFAFIAATYIFANSITTSPIYAAGALATVAAIGLYSARGDRSVFSAFGVSSMFIILTNCLNIPIASLAVPATIAAFKFMAPAQEVAQNAEVGANVFTAQKFSSTIMAAAMATGPIATLVCNIALDVAGLVSSARIGNTEMMPLATQNLGPQNFIAGQEDPSQNRRQAAPAEQDNRDHNRRFPNNYGAGANGQRLGEGNRNNNDQNQGPQNRPVVFI